MTHVSYHNRASIPSKKCFHKWDIDARLYNTPMFHASYRC